MTEIHQTKVPRAPLDLSRKVLWGFLAAEGYVVLQSILDSGFNWKLQLGVALSAAVAYFKTEVFRTA